jgi:hypothetical protein
VVRDARDDKPITITSDDIRGLTWEEGMKLWELTPEQRIEMEDGPWSNPTWNMHERELRERRSWRYSVGQQRPRAVESS